MVDPEEEAEEEEELVRPYKRGRTNGSQPTGKQWFSMALGSEVLDNGDEEEEDEENKHHDQGMLEPEVSEEFEEQEEEGEEDDWCIEDGWSEREEHFSPSQEEGYVDSDEDTVESATGTDTQDSDEDTVESATGTDTQVQEEHNRNGQWAQFSDELNLFIYNSTSEIGVPGWVMHMRHRTGGERFSFWRPAVSTDPYNPFEHHRIIDQYKKQFLKKHKQYVTRTCSTPSYGYMVERNWGYLY